MDFQHLSIERPTDTDSHVAEVTLRRPTKANALNYEVLYELEQVALSLRDDTDSRVVILRGEGKHFSSGADLSDDSGDYGGSLLRRQRRLRIGERCIEAWLNIDQITIAAWQGAAMGGGACLATACDFRIGSRNCFMQYPEVDIGLNLMWQSLPLLVNLIGPARSKRLVAGGERIAADTLLAWGVLDELVDLDSLTTKATQMAAHYAAKPPVAVQMIKRSTNHIANALNRSIMHMDADQNLLASKSEDRAKAVAAYLNGESADFTGN